MRILRAVIAIILVMSLTLDVHAIDRRRKVITGCQNLSGLNRIPSLVLWYEGDGALVDGSNNAYQLPDLSRSHNNAQQTTPANRPFRFDAIGGPGPVYFNVLYFDGTDDYMQFSPINNIGSSFAVAWSSAVSDYTSQRPIVGNTGGAFNRIAQLSSTTTGIIYNNGLSYTFTHAATDDGFMHHNILTSDGEHYVDGVASTRAGSLGTGLSFDLLAGTGAANYGSGLIDDVAIFTSPLSKADKNYVGNFLKDRHGGSWTNIP